MAKHLSLYARALEQRNALLKLLAERGGDANQLDYWDNLLAEQWCTHHLLDEYRALQELGKNRFRRFIRTLPQGMRNSTRFCTNPH